MRMHRDVLRVIRIGTRLDIGRRDTAWVSGVGSVSDSQSREFPLGWLNSGKPTVKD